MLLLIVLGFVALGLEVSQLLLEQRKQQSVADSAAMAAAYAAKLGVTDLQGEARAVGAQLGYRNAVGGVAVTMASPPTAGPHAGDAKYVEVRVDRTVTPGLIQLFRTGSFTVRARAVAHVGSSGAAVCALLLEGSSADALKLDSKGTLTISNCAINVNSTSSSAVSMYNNTKIVGDVNVAGNVVNQNSSAITGTVTKGAPAGADPYASLAVQASGTQRSVPNLQTGNEQVTLDPGIYNSGWNFWGNQKVTLKPGVYFVQGNIGGSGNVSISGTGVTIVIDGNYTMNLNGSTSLSLTAPTSGVTSGIAIYSKATSDQQFTNNTGITITGALYFPKQTVSFNSNATNNSASSCTQLIAKKLYLTNNVEVVLNGSCAGAGTSSLGASSPSTLVE